MSGLAEDDLKEGARPHSRVWMLRIGFALGGSLLVVGLAWWLHHLIHGTQAPRQQVVKIMVLPDTPPPPPPPEEKKPEPEKDENKPLEQDKPKPVEAQPEPQQLKMDGPAGDAPSAFAAGEVKSDYAGGDIGSARTRYASYVSSLEQHLREELQRKNLRGVNVKVYLWLNADGSIQRFKLGAASADESGKALHTALAQLGPAAAPPGDLPQPVGLQVTIP